jgi:taurine dioxygenase
MRVTRLGPVFGAEIGEVDLRAPVEEKTLISLKNSLYEHEVLVVRDQDLSGDDMMALGRAFGELWANPFSPARTERPELIIFDNHDSNPPALTDVWHADETYRQAPPAVTMLHSLIAPALGGGTMFVSMRAAYESLSDRMKAFISGLTARHDFGRFESLFPDTPEGRKPLHDIELRFPHPSHPVVRIHPETGKPVIYVNSHFTRRLNELPEDEGKAILDFLLSRTNIPELQLRVDWKAGTLVIWDNRSVQHYALHDYYPQRRRMQRVTISGDRPVGDADPPEKMIQRIVVADPPEQPESSSVPKETVRRPFERAYS